MKIGVLMCGWECDEYIDRVLAPWTEIKNNSKHQFVFSVVYAQFKEWAELFGAQEVRKPSWIDKYQEYIDAFDTCAPATEAEIKSVALKPLLDDDCDIIWLLDLSDEFYTIESINKTINFIEKTGATYYDLAYRNYIFDANHYLDTIYFKRIFRNYKNNPIIGMRYDCDFTYQNGEDRLFPRIRVPESFCLVDHYSWFSDERGKRKVEYQQKRWGADLCSYKWNYELNKLELNENHYNRFQKQLPVIYNK